MGGSQKRGRRSLLLEKLAEKQQQRRVRMTDDTVTDSGDLSEQQDGRLRATRTEELTTSTSASTTTGTSEPDDATGQSCDGRLAPSASVSSNFMAFGSNPSLLAPPAISPLDVSRLPTPHRVTCIEDILLRETAVTVIDLYFNHLYPIVPVVHRPSFMTDLGHCRDHRDRKFLALALGIIAMTLLYMPRPFLAGIDIDMSTGAVISDAQALELSTSASGLSQRCSQACETILREENNSPSVDTLSTKYLLFTIYDVSCTDTTFNVIHWESSVTLRSETRSTERPGEHIWGASVSRDMDGLPPRIDPIEAERRRRMWSLIRNAGTFEAVLTDRPVSFRSDDFVNDTDSAELPKELWVTVIISF
ncbi:Hypothetical Protein CGB_K4620C [Cryptococcus gattii WM276]|uniref:Xylanolytic transcriptional activator regulatory domain-containing protein n=1 Tax=Cryptococcus gattii serotype B (strain WM276 / ATCC MYA-4071) TaxID=367775 RepID=E6RE34_CRYGW|nr:Hypothetical Protein CGB_K4620C [Cryptococcus gattii WM276]ADV25056.1 Hypothetical Protein CGB_K4620C [Cryptococcus gattii WM276]